MPILFFWDGHLRKTVWHVDFGHLEAIFGGIQWVFGTAAPHCCAMKKCSTQGGDGPPWQWPKGTFKSFAPGEARTHGLQIMRLTRCLLRYRGLGVSFPN